MAEDLLGLAEETSQHSIGSSKVYTLLPRKPAIGGEQHRTALPVKWNRSRRSLRYRHRWVGIRPDSGTGCSHPLIGVQQPGRLPVGRGVPYIFHPLAEKDSDLLIGQSRALPQQEQQQFELQGAAQTQMVIHH